MSDARPAGTPSGDDGFLALDGLVKEFDGGVRAVDGISLAVRRGEILALLGSSGCGKSTLLRMLAGFERPTAGRIVLDGRDITALPPHVRPINMMFQSYALFPHLTVYDNIAFGLRRDGLPADEIREIVDRHLQLVQLRGLEKRKPAQLSGGQQQRVALARALAKRPQVLLLDEPLGALDKKLREQTQMELVDIVHRVGVTCVMVTHDQEEAMTMASRIAVMSGGRILQAGAPRDIYESPSCRFVADFIGNINLLPGIVMGREDGVTTVRTDLGEFRVPGAAPVVAGAGAAIALRPEKIRIGAVPDGGPGNLLRGRIEQLSYHGSLTTFHVGIDACHSLRVASLNSTRADGGRLAQGDPVVLQWDDDAMAIVSH